MTKVAGLFGWPVEHSLSPGMQNAAFAAAELDYTYVPFAVPPARLAEAVQAIRALGLVGANVTIPHKIEVMQYLDEITENARRIGAVNTIVNQNGYLIGHNTDGDGFIHSLREQAVAVVGRQILMLGAGGAARAVAAGLLAAGCSKVIVAARALERAQELTQHFTGMPVEAQLWSDLDESGLLQKTDILINATPLGMSPHTDQMPSINWELLNPTAVICDLVYNPLVTQFLRYASQRGHKVITGEGMLAGQGALAFQLWTGKTAPFSIMLSAVQQHFPIF